MKFEINPSRAEANYSKLESAEDVHGLVGTPEGLNLECKRWQGDEKPQKAGLAQCISGFANADGGVIIIGLRAVRQGTEEPDIIQRGEPVKKLANAFSQVSDWIGEIVEPIVPGIEVKSIAMPPDDVGYIVIKIPATELMPVRSRIDNKFYQRITASTRAMEYFQIADMFGRRSRPKLFPLFEFEAPTTGPFGQPVQNLIVGLENAGRNVARFPSIRFDPASFSLDDFGIDGNRGLGLPRIPTRNHHMIFAGGADHVVHPGTQLWIAKFRRSGNRGKTYVTVGRNDEMDAHFPLVTLEVTVSAYGAPSESQIFSEDVQTVRI